MIVVEVESSFILRERAAQSLQGLRDARFPYVVSRGASSGTLFASRAAQPSTLGKLTRARFQALVRKKYSLHSATARPGLAVPFRVAWMGLRLSVARKVNIFACAPNELVTSLSEGSSRYHALRSGRSAQESWLDRRLRTYLFGNESFLSFGSEGLSFPPFSVINLPLF